jgi:uncharacterized surface protein with fasciclin (FAS1) repeats
MIRRISLATSVVLTGVLLAACGSSSSSTATTAKPAATTTATTTAATMAPATTTAATMSASTMSASTMVPASGDIVAVAAGNTDFSTLVAAVKAAGLVETLQGAGPFTVFAPTNEAFAKLPAGLVDKLLKPENKAVLVKILTYHVLASKVMAADVKPGNATTVEGDPIAITVASGKVQLNGSTNVVATDVAASNGVIHVIDSVLLPPGVDPSKL